MPLLPSRPLRGLLLAAVALLVLLSQVSPAAAAAGEITGDVPARGTGLVVWGGGDIEALITSAADEGCPLISVWRTDDSGWTSYVVGAPAFVNARFLDRYPAGIPADEILVLSCGLPSPVSLSASSIRQGGAIAVRVRNAEAGTATLLGTTFALAPDGDDLVGYVAAGTEANVGSATLTIRATGSDGEAIEGERRVTVRRTEWTVDYITIPPPDPDAPPPPPDEQARLTALYRGDATPRRWAARWGSPLEERVVSGRFGEQRSYNGGPVQGHHGGTDFAAAEGTPILASNAGTVVLAELTRNRGNLVVIDHGSGVFTSYGHLSRLAVAAGERVRAGEVIGDVGMTGLATGPHLHWELAVGGILVDGLRWLDGSQGF